MEDASSLVLYVNGKKVSANGHLTLTQLMLIPLSLYVYVCMYIIVIIVCYISYIASVLICVIYIIYIYIIAIIIYVI